MYAALNPRFAGLILGLACTVLMPIPFVFLKVSRSLLLVRSLAETDLPSAFSSSLDRRQVFPFLHRSNSSSRSDTSLSKFSDSRPVQERCQQVTRRTRRLRLDLPSLKLFVDLHLRLLCCVFSHFLVLNLMLLSCLTSSRPKCIDGTQSRRESSSSSLPCFPPLFEGIHSLYFLSQKDC